MSADVPPISTQQEFKHDAYLQLFGSLGWGFFQRAVTDERSAVAQSLLAADPRDPVTIATLQGLAQGFQLVLDYEARVRAATQEGSIS